MKAFITPDIAAYTNSKQYVVYIIILVVYSIGFNSIQYCEMLNGVLLTHCT